MARSAAAVPAGSSRRRSAKRRRRAKGVSARGTATRAAFSRRTGGPVLPDLAAAQERWEARLDGVADDLTGGRKGRVRAERGAAGKRRAPSAPSNLLGQAPLPASAPGREQTSP